MKTGDGLAFATQGNEFSWHAEAARHAAGTDNIQIMDCPDFDQVMTASINWDPGFGVMAVKTARGVVEPSARKFFALRTSAQSSVVKRIDLEIGLSLIGSVDQTIEELNRPGVTCYLQEEAQLQIDEFKKVHLPWLKYERRKESTHAVQEALEMQSPDHIAVGPSYSAARVGGFVLGPGQINPQGSITSFYVLQRDFRQQILPVDPRFTDKLTVIGLSYPDLPGELDKCLEAMVAVGIEPVRYIPFRVGDPTRHNPDITKNGGFVEVRHEFYDPEVTKFCGKINKLVGQDRVVGPFNAKRLGEYSWVPQPLLTMDDIRELIAGQSAADSQ